MMRNNLIPMALAIFLLCPSGAYSQNASHSVEFGLGDLVGLGEDNAERHLVLAQPLNEAKVVVLRLNA